MANRHKSQSAGKSGAHAEAYSGGSSKVAEEAKKTTGGFKKGGKVEGKKHKKHFARGGRTGGSPFSSAKIKENTAA